MRWGDNLQLHQKVAHHDVRLQGVVSKIRRSEIGEGIHHRLLTYLGGPVVWLYPGMPAEELIETGHPLLQELHLLARASARPDWVGIPPFHVDYGFLQDEDHLGRHLEAEPAETRGEP